MTKNRLWTCRLRMLVSAAFGLVAMACTTPTSVRATDYELIDLTGDYAPHWPLTGNRLYSRRLARTEPGLT